MIVADQDHLSDVNFIVSPIEIWAIFLTMAEQAKKQSDHKTLKQLLQVLHLQEETDLQQEFRQYCEFVKIIVEDFQVKQLWFQFENKKFTSLLGDRTGKFEYKNDGSQIDYDCKLKPLKEEEKWTVDTSDDGFKASIQWKNDKKVDLLTLSAIYSMKTFEVSTQITITQNTSFFSTIFLILEQYRVII